jgi:hypothetical protein
VANAETPVTLHVNADAFSAAAKKLEADVKKAIEEFNENARFTIGQDTQSSRFDRLGRVL